MAGASGKDGQDGNLYSTIPMTWQSGAEKVQTNANVVRPDDANLRAYQNGQVKTCGSCKYFDHKHGQEQIVEERFAERLVQEMGWKVKHLGAPLDSLGLCGAGDKTLATSPVAAACDQYRPR